MPLSGVDGGFGLGANGHVPPRATNQTMISPTSEAHAIAKIANRASNVHPRGFGGTRESRNHADCSPLSGSRHSSACLRLSLLTRVFLALSEGDGKGAPSDDFAVQNEFEPMETKLADG